MSYAGIALALALLLLLALVSWRERHTRPPEPEVDELAARRSVRPLGNVDRRQKGDSDDQHG
jgi:hypothetical protein